MGMEFRPTSVVEVETEHSRRLKVSRATHYLYGFRMDDIRAAIKSGGSCLALLCLIHFRRAVTGQEAVTLPSGFLAEYGIGRSAKRRGLKSLEEAKIINVKRGVGHTALIELRARTRKRRAAPTKQLGV
jgi:hypothetical protein